MPQEVFGVCPFCEEVHKIVPVSSVPAEGRLRMYGIGSGAEYVMAKHAFGEYGSPCAAGSPFLVPPERIVPHP